MQILTLDPFFLLTLVLVLYCPVILHIVWKMILPCIVLDSKYTDYSVFKFRFFKYIGLDLIKFM